MYMYMKTDVHACTMYACTYDNIPTRMHTETVDARIDDLYTKDGRYGMKADPISSWMEG